MNKDYINLQVMRKAKVLNNSGNALDEKMLLKEKVSTVHPAKRVTIFLVGIIFAVVGALVMREPGIAFWAGLGMILFGSYFCVVAIFGWRKRIKEITSALDAVSFTHLIDGNF